MRQNDRAAFAARIKQLRAMQGTSYDAIGARVGCSGEAVRRWENAKASPRTREEVSRLEDAIGAAAGELWGLLTGEPVAVDTSSDDDLLHRLVSDVAALADRFEALEQATRELDSRFAARTATSDARFAELRELLQQPAPRRRAPVSRDRHD